jgi:hypothetical protein
MVRIYGRSGGKRNQVFPAAAILRLNWVLSGVTLAIRP